PSCTGPPRAAPRDAARALAAPRSVPGRPLGPGAAVGPPERPRLAALAGVRDQPRQPALAGRLLLRARHPPRQRPAVRGRLRLEEPPRRLAGAEAPLEGRWQLVRGALVRVDPRPARRPRLERPQTGGVHQALGDQLLHPPDVDLAPDAAAPAWREPYPVARVRVAHVPAVYPDEGY